MLYRRILRISLLVYLSNGFGVRKTEAKKKKKKLIHKTRKSALKLLGNITRKEGLENLTPTVYPDCESERDI